MTTGYRIRIANPDEWEAVLTALDGRIANFHEDGSADGADCEDSELARTIIGETTVFPAEIDLDSALAVQVAIAITNESELNDEDTSAGAKAVLANSVLPEV